MNRLLFSILCVIIACTVHSAFLYAQFETDLRSKDHLTLEMIKTQIPADKLQRLNAVVRQGASLSLPDALQAALDSARSIYGIIGVSAAMIVPGYGLWLGTSGYSDPTVHDTITSDMLFGIASNTKTYVAATMLKLQEEGVLTLDDSLHEWLPTYRQDQYRYIDSTITIRQLLNHTSGIYDFMWADAYWTSIVADPARFWMPESVLTNFGSPRRFTAGTKYEYSNTNYLLAGMIIKAATHSTVSTQLRQRFLTPLNLDRTFLAVEDSLAGIRAHPWSDMYSGTNISDVYSFPLTAFYSSAWTAGAMFSTPENMVRWISNLYGGKVLQESSLNQMLTFSPQSGEFYGLGVERGKFQGNTFIGYKGSVPGYDSFTGYFPAARLSMATTQNCNENHSDYAAVFLFNAYLQHTIDIAANRGYYRPGIDTVWLRAQVSNPNAHPLTVRAYIDRSGTVVDSLLLYDDGLHHDSIAGDGVWGMYWKAPAVENSYNVTITASDPVDSTFLIQDNCHFTIAGPLTVDSVKKTSSPPYWRVTPYVKNNGKILTISGVSVNLICNDPWVISISPQTLLLSDIPPGGRVNTSGFFNVKYDTVTYPGYINVKFELAINGYVYWTDSTKLTATGVKEEEILPITYELQQNYPNPFNPTTVISYQLPVNSYVTLKIFDMLGREVATLVNEKKDAGRYSVQWDASRFSSGVYFYKLEARHASTGSADGPAFRDPVQLDGQAGSFTQTRKLLLLK